MIHIHHIKQDFNIAANFDSAITFFPYLGLASREKFFEFQRLPSGSGKIDRDEKLSHTPVRETNLMICTTVVEIGAITLFQQSRRNTSAYQSD